MRPSLVILAAGLGRRYGGLKQVAGIGPSGAALMEYSAYDARRAGFEHVVLVIGAKMEAALRAGVGQRFERGGLTVSYVEQRLDDLPNGWRPPAGRTRPWGTGQAVLAAARVVDGPFAAINADDFYGRAAFAAIGEFLRERTQHASRDSGSRTRQAGVGPATHAMIGYRLRDTLPERGEVARAICRCSADGWLESIVETRGIAPAGSGARCMDAHGSVQLLSGDEPVSMNMWSFQTAIFEELRRGFREFLEQSGCSDDAEYYLPAAVQAAITADRARVQVLPAAGEWCGLTHAEDRARVEQTIAELVARGEYPSKLWS